MKYTIAILASLFFSTAAFAANMVVVPMGSKCGELQTVVGALWKSYGEVPMGDSLDAEKHLLLNPTTGTFTILQRLEGTIYCLIGYGEGAPTDATLESFGH